MNDMSEQSLPEGQRLTSGSGQSGTVRLAEGQLLAVSYLRARAVTGRGDHTEQELRLLEQQRQAYESAAGRMRAILIEEYADLGNSANDRERPALTAMLKRLQAGDVDYVIVASGDRLARAFDYYQELQAAIEKCGARLIVADVEGDGMAP